MTGEPHVAIDDVLFLALARKVGLPSPEVIASYVAMQRERASRGANVGLFALLCENGALTLDEEGKFRDLARVLDAAAATPPPPAPASAPSPVPAPAPPPAPVALPPLPAALPPMPAALPPLPPAPTAPGHGAEPGAQELIRRFAANPGSSARVAAALAPPGSPAPPPAPRPASERVAAAPPSPSARVAAAPPPAPSPSPPEPPAVPRLSSSARIRAASAPAAPEPPKPAKGLGRTLSSKRVAHARPGQDGVPRSGSNTTLIAGVVGVAAVAAAVAGMVAVTRHPTGSDESAPDVAASSTPERASSPSATISPAPADLAPSPAPASEKDAVDAASAAVLDAQLLELDGHELEASSRLEAALVAAGASGEASRLILDAQAKLLDRCRGQIERSCAEVDRLVRARDASGARLALARLVPHVPPALRPELEAALRRIATAARERAQGTDEKPDEVVVADGASPGEASSDVSKLVAARPSLDGALASLDTAAAAKILDGVTGKGPDFDSELELDRARTDGVARLVAGARAGLPALVGRDVAFDTGAGRAQGKLARLAGDALTIALAGGGERDLGLLELAPRSLLEVARAGAPGAERDACTFGAGVVLACRGDRAGALELLSHVDAIAAAARLRERLESDAQATAGSTPAPVNAAPTAPPPATTSTVARRPTGDDATTLPPPPAWTQDTKGSVPWDRGYTLESEHYVLRTDVRPEYAKKYLAFLEALAERYLQVFQFAGNDFHYKKNEVFLYNGYDEYRVKEAAVLARIDAIGFYEFGSKRLVTFHGPVPNADSTTTLTVLAHEATHQVQNLVLRRMQNAPIFMLEGLARFFEGSQTRENGDVIVGAIPPDALHELQRAIRAGEEMPLATVIRTPQSSFGALHYDHAWALLHWLMWGPEKKKAQRLLDWYWERCLERPTTPEDFENGLAAMGYSMEKVQRAWREWVLSLDPQHDPAVQWYDAHHRGKKAH